MPNKPPNRARYKGTAKATALALFGIPRLMEEPEQREQLAKVFVQSSDPRFQSLARMATQPVFAHISFAKLAEQNALNIHMISDEYKRIMLSEGFMRSAQHLPKLMEQATAEALSTEETCPSCEGLGKIIKRGRESRCKRCNGKRVIFIPGDIDRMRLVFETFGLTGKGSAGVNVNLDLRNVRPHETMSELSASIAPILEGVVQDAAEPVRAHEASRAEGDE